MPKKEFFPERLRRVRTAKGLSQYDLADLTGISQRMIVHYEKHSKKIAPATVSRLAKALHVSPGELMGFEPLKQKEPLVKNRRLLKKLKLLDQFSSEDQKKIIGHIDDINTKYNGK